MGGLALKSTHTRRYQRKEFDALWIEVSGIIGKTFKQFSMPRYFESKESFGDMDIIISLEGFDYETMREYITTTFKPNEIFHNGHSWSFDYKEIQIDFITCPAEDYESYEHYFAFNDLGNFIGRMAQVMGLKYGQEGLWYNHYNGNQKTKIIISKDYPKIFDYLGLDYSKWITGFDSLEEIFEYVKTSRFFNPEIFQMHHLNKINRERNLKRASYIAFLEYIEGEECNKDYDVLEVEYHKENLIKIIDEAFPEADVRLEVKRLEYFAAKSDYATAKFNGHIVMEKYGLKGKELGNSIQTFQTHIQEEHQVGYIDFLVDMDEETIFKFFELSNNM